MEGISHYDRVAERFTFEDPALLFSALVGSVVGFVQYYYCVVFARKGGKGPLPLWMHTFYLAHDSSWSYLLHGAADRYNGHWFFSGTSVALAVWSALEIYCIYKVLTTERNETFSTYFGPNPPLSKAFWYTLSQLSVMYAVIFLGILFVGEGCVMQWFSVTNAVMVFGVTPHWLTRGSRDGLSVAFAIATIFGTLFTFAPFGQFALVMPEVFATTPFYSAGAILQVLSLFNLSVVLSYPSLKQKRN